MVLLFYTSEFKRRKKFCSFDTTVIDIELYQKGIDAIYFNLRLNNGNGEEEALFDSEWIIYWRTSHEFKTKGGKSILPLLS